MVGLGVFNTVGVGVYTVIEVGVILVVVVGEFVSVVHDPLRYVLYCTSVTREQADVEQQQTEEPQTISYGAHDAYNYNQFQLYYMHWYIVMRCYM